MKEREPTLTLGRPHRRLRRRVAVGLLIVVLVVVGRVVFFHPGEAHEEAVALANRLKLPASYGEADRIIQRLRSIGDPAIPVLLSHLREPHGDEYYIKKALVAMGEPVIEPLVDFVEKGDISRFEIAWKLWPRLPRWLQSRYRNPGSERATKGHAFEIATAIAPQSEAVFAMLERGSDHPYEFSRGQAIYSMRLLDPKFAERILPLLEEARHDASPVVRVHAVIALKALIEHTEPDEALLVEFLEDKDPTVRRRAADALSRYQNPGPIVVAALRKGLTDKDPPTRFYFAKACWQVEALRDLALEVLRQNFREKKEVFWTLMAIEDLDPAPKALLSDIEPLLNDEQAVVRLRAARCYYRYLNDSPVVFETLFSIIRSGSPAEQWEALKALRELKLERATPMPLILEVLDGNYGRYGAESKLDAVRVFARMGPRALKYSDRLDKLMTHEWVKLQEAAHEAREAILESVVAPTPSRKAGSDL